MTDVQNFIQINTFPEGFLLAGGFKHFILMLPWLKQCFEAQAGDLAVLLQGGSPLVYREVQPCKKYILSCWRRSSAEQG